MIVNGNWTVTDKIHGLINYSSQDFKRDALLEVGLSSGGY